LNIDPNILARLKTAYSTKESEETYEKIILDLKNAGVSQREIYNTFSEFLENIMEHGTDEQNEALQYMMDRVVGWCNKEQRFFDEYFET